MRKRCPRQLVTYSGTPFLADNVTGPQRLNVAHIAGLEDKSLNSLHNVMRGRYDSDVSSDQGDVLPRLLNGRKRLTFGVRGQS